MKQSDTKRILELLTQLTEAVGVPPPGPPPGAPKALLSDRVDGLSDRVDARFDAVDLQFTRVDARFDRVDGAIESTRVQLVDLVGSVHSELTGRIIDLEVPEPGGRGGSPSGSGGVPLAS